MKSQLHHYSATGFPLVFIRRIATPAMLTSTTLVLSWEMLMRKTLRASSMITSGESWRLPAASLQELAVTHPNHAHQMDSLGAKWVDWERHCLHAWVSSRLGTASRQRPTTCTTTNMLTTSITLVSGNQKNRWRLRRPCVFTVAFIMDQSSAATLMASLRSMLGKLVNLSSTYIKNMLSVTVVFCCYTGAKAHSVKELPRKAKMCGFMTCPVLQRRWRKTRRSCCGWWKDKKKQFNIRGARMGQWWHLNQ